MAFSTLYGQNNKCTLNEQINTIEHDIIMLLNRLRGLEDLLDNADLNEEHRTLIEEELLALRSKVNDHKEFLKRLHKDNTRPVMMITCFIFITFLVFGLYRMFYKIY